MKILFLIFTYLFLSSLCYAQWVQQQSNTARHLLGIDMIDSNTGYICGDMVGGIIKTINSGTNWIIYHEPTGDGYGGISFIDVNTGITVGPPGLVLRTTNGGLIWSIISQPGGDKGDVQFVSTSVAYAVGDDIIKSTDGGLTWTQIFTGYLSQYQGVYFTDVNNGTVVGLHGTIYTTTNGGSTWIQRLMMLPVQFGDSSLFSVKYISSFTAYACSIAGFVIKTTNSGINWIYEPIGATSYFRGICIINVDTVFVVGEYGRIYKTTNGGINWNQQNSPTTDPLWDVDFVDANTGWIVGFNGTILKTTNGGIAWVKPISKGVPSGFELYQNYPNPFNPTTTIKYAIAKTCLVRISVFDILGREIAVVVNEKQSPGIYETQFDAVNYPSGVYFYRIEAGDFVEAKKMVLVK